MAQGHNVKQAVVRILSLFMVFVVSLSLRFCPAGNAQQACFAALHKAPVQDTAWKELCVQTAVDKHTT